MFSFHRPRVYRSADGCCICRAKSSSSRFTDSKKYEADSIKCFDLKHPRHGEICNACVLLVKRFKRLPVGSDRHWGHVVDARAGPGMKSMSKFKKQKEESAPSHDRGHSQKSLLPEKFSKIFKKNKKKSAKVKNKSQAWEHQPLPLTPESLDSDCEEIASYTQTTVNASSVVHKPTGSSRRKNLAPKKFRGKHHDKFKFYDEKTWIERKSCCGIVLEHKQLGAVILDLDKYSPCAEHRRNVSVVKDRVAMPIQNFTVQQQFITKSGTYQLQPNPPPSEVRSNNTTNTPALKKHHLFYKRQSESFPLGDMTQPSTLNSHANTPKTDLILDVKVLSTPFPTSSTVKIAKLNPGTHTINHLPSTSSKMPSASTMAVYDPQHQYHKPTSSKSGSFLHKMKSDTGKIVKHSLEKISTLRLRPSELSDIKNITKVADKPFVIKPIMVDRAKMIPVDNTIASAVQSVATKFNDNSSDSGFDENILDRKSVSPLQDDNDKRTVQTMYLANGVPIRGEAQNILLTGNEVTTRMLQSRPQTSVTSNIKVAHLLTNGVATSNRMRQSTDSITIISPVQPTVTSITLPSTTTTTSHLNKSLANIINSSNTISTSGGQNVVIMKKYNCPSNLNPNSCKN